MRGPEKTGGNSVHFLGAIFSVFFGSSRNHLFPSGFVCARFLAQPGNPTLRSHLVDETGTRF